MRKEIFPHLVNHMPPGKKTLMGEGLSLGEISIKIYLIENLY